MALTDRLTAIGEAIREKSGKNDKLTLAEMPDEIRSLQTVTQTEEIIKHADIPDYVKEEALNVISKVQSVQRDDSIIFLAMSDNHYYGEQGSSGVDNYVDSNGTQGNTSNLHAAMAAKVLAYAMNFDFVAHLGDAAWGHKTTHSALLNSQIDTFLGMLEEAHVGIPCFHAIGNHDTGYEYHKNQSSGIHVESGQNLYNKFTARSASDDTVFGDIQYGGYCYRDLPDKKLRVFLLNSCEYHVYNQTDNGLLGSQLKWFAEALLNLNEKEDSDEWKCLVLCHYPADYSVAAPLSNLLKAYVEGGSITVSVEDGTSYTVNFSGKNNARFIAQFHGHVHNFLVSKLHTQQDGTPVKFDALRICIPNGQYNRENYYSVVGGIDYSEPIKYPKTINTANDTAFVINVINPSEEKIYSFCYGAGYDRVIGYEDTVYYSITNNLSNVVSDNSAISAEEGTAYTTTLTVADGYTIEAITVTMGGEDVTAAVVSNGVITISAVTGNVVITAKAQARPNFTNLVPLSIDVDGSDYNADGDGYDNGVYISSSGTLTSKTGITTTGFIPVSEGKKTIRVAGEGISVDPEYTRFGFYDNDFAFLGAIPYKRLGEAYYPTLTEETATVLTITTRNNDTVVGGGVGVYMRICTPGDGANLIVTVDEEIKYGGAV